LCEGYSIAGEYASFIVLENDAEYARWSIERRNAIRVRRDDTARVRLQQELQTLRDASLSELAPGEPQSVAATDPRQSPGNASSIPAPTFDNFNPSVSTTPTDLNWSRPDSSGSSPGIRSGGGGGAIDPITGLLAMSLVGAAAASRKRRRAKQCREGEEGSTGSERL